MLKKNNLNIYFNLLDKKLKLKFLSIGFLIFINSILEFISIGSIVPIIQSLITPDTNLIYQINFLEKFNLDQSDIFFWALFVFLFVFIIRTIFSISLNSIFHSFIKDLRYDLTKKFMDYFLSSSHIEISKNGASNVTRILDKEIDIVTINITDALLKIFNNLFLIISLIFLIFVIAPQAMVMILILSIVVLIIYFFYLKKRIKEFGLKRINYIKNKMSLAHNIFNAFKEIIIYSKEVFFKNIYSDLSKKLFITDQKFNFFQTNVKPGLELLAVGSLFIYSMYLFKYTSLEISEIILQFGVIVAASFRILPSISLITSCIMTLRYHGPSIQLIYSEIYKVNNNVNHQQKVIINFENEIILKNIDFSYNKKKVFNNLNLEIKKNSITGIFGPSGAGKTTLIEIITGIIKPDKGEIIIDGNKKENFLINTSFVSQDIAIINDTIEKNIALGSNSEDIDKSKLIDAIKKAELFDLVNSLENKFQSNLNEMGSNLSGGQKQRISIARALYKNSDFLIVDEPTSALDDTTAEKVIDALIKNFSTIVIVSHKKEILKKCENLIEIK